MRFPYRALHPMRSLKEAIDASKPDLIVPGDERAVAHLHELHAQAVKAGSLGAGTRALIERSLGSPQSYSVVRSRFEILRLAREEGILAPESGPVRNKSDLDEWGGRHAFPWVLKNDGNCAGQGVRVVDTLAKARRAWRRLAAHPTTLYVAKRLLANRDPYPVPTWLRGERPAVTVQTFVPGTPANISVAAWKGEVLAAFSVSVCKTLKENGPASVVRLIDNPVMLQAAVRLARRLDLSGFFGLDFMIERGTQKPYLIELNPRVTQLCHLPLGRGRDLTGALYERLSSVPAADSPHLTVAGTIAIFPNAWMQNLGDEFFTKGFHDVPWEEPDLVDEMLKALWCNRGSLHAAIEWLKSVTRDGGTEVVLDGSARQLNRPQDRDAMPAKNPAKTGEAVKTSA